MCEVLDRIENRGIEKGIQQGENAFAGLMKVLFAQGRTEDARRASEDAEYRHSLMEELAASESSPG